MNSMFTIYLSFKYLVLYLLIISLVYQLNTLKKGFYMNEPQEGDEGGRREEGKEEGEPHALVLHQNCRNTHQSRKSFQKFFFYFKFCQKFYFSPQDCLVRNCFVLMLNILAPKIPSDLSYYLLVTET